MKRKVNDLGRAQRELRTGRRYCSRLAWYGGYCRQHAKKLTGFYEPDKNEKPDGYCSWLIEESISETAKEVT